jgi:3-oxoacyl-[acyl-carrier protein] reductase
MVGKVALVSGNSGDIGRQVSLQLAAAGAKVCFTYFGNKATAEETLALIKVSGGEAIAVHANMTMIVDIQKVVQNCIDTFGDDIHILVNLPEEQIAEKVSSKKEKPFYDELLNLYLTSIFLTTKAVRVFMPKGCAVVHLSSMITPSSGFVKSADDGSSEDVLTLTKSMAKELAPKGIRVNCISPTLMHTAAQKKFVKPAMKTHDAMDSDFLQNEVKPEGIAQMAVFLTSEKAKAFTGRCVDIHEESYII